MKYEYDLYDDTKGVPKIEIYVDTYNHEKYIVQTIESILMQKTQYLYKVIIADDCSNDNTTLIIKEYQRKYPDKFIVATSKINTRGKFTRDLVRDITQAEYVASIDGDDYWTDEYKLEKQITFLDEHPEYIGITGNVRIVNEDGTLQHSDFSLYGFRNSHIYSKNNVLKYELVSHISALTHRNIFLGWTEEDFDDFYECKANGDRKLSAILGIMGDIYYSSDIYGDHRRVFEGTSWTAKTKGAPSKELVSNMRSSLDHYIEKKFGLNLLQSHVGCLTTEQKVKNYESEIVKLRNIVRIYDMLLLCRENNLSIGRYLKDCGYTLVSIYGLGILGQRVINELKEVDLTVAYAIDRNTLINIPYLIVYPSYDKKACPDVDLTIVTTISDFESIEEDLKNNGCNNVISLDDIIYQMIIASQNR